MNSSTLNWYVSSFMKANITEVTYKYIANIAQLPNLPIYYIIDILEPFILSLKRINAFNKYLKPIREVNFLIYNRV